jgi:cytochrome P450
MSPPVAEATSAMARLHAPVQLTQQVVTEDLDLVGFRVRTGDEIMLRLGAANRDPLMFGEPQSP